MKGLLYAMESNVCRFVLKDCAAKSITLFYLVLSVSV